MAVSRYPTKSAHPQRRTALMEKRNPKYPSSQHAILFLHVCLFLFLFSSVAQAAGMFLPSRGVHPLSRGGASIAGGDTLQTIWYNPANLVEMKGISVLVDVGVIVSSARFARQSRKSEEGGTINYEAVDNEASPIPDPTLIGSYHWADHNLTVAFGFYAPYASGLKFPDTGSQRYALVDMSGSIFLISNLAFAWSPHPNFRLGAGLQNYTVSVRLITAASGYLGPFGAPEDKNLDLYTEATIDAPMNISGNAGIWGRVIDTPQIKLDMAASVQFPVAIQAKGNIRVRLPTHALFDPSSIEGSAIEASMWLPLIARGALRATIMGRGNVEFAIVYENWAVHDSITMTPSGNGIKVKNVPTIGDYVIPSLRVERGFRDTLSFRLGGGAEVLPGRLEVRAGYAYENSAVPDEYVTVFSMDPNKHVIALGATIKFGKHAIDLTYAHYLQQRREITTSKYKQLNPLNPEGAIVIGNGVYDSSVNVFGLSWRGQF